MIKFLKKIKPASSEDTYNIHKKGKEGEDKACSYLKKQGYRIIERNFRTDFGEIDIIAGHKKCTVFVEVKSRGSDSFAMPEENVGPKKQRRIIKSAEVYLLERGLYGTECRFDIISLTGEGDKTEIKLIRNAFETE